MRDWGGEHEHQHKNWIHAFVGVPFSLHSAHLAPLGDVGLGDVLDGDEGAVADPHPGVHGSEAALQWSQFVAVTFANSGREWSFLVRDNMDSIPERG